MERNKKIQIYCLAAASVLIGVFGAVCLFLAVAGEYNDAMGYFNTDSLFAPVLYCCLCAGPLLGGVGWFLFRKHSAPDEALPCGISVKIASCLCAAIIFMVIAFEIYGFAGRPASAILKIEMISWVFAVLCSASLIVGGFLSKSGAPVKPFVSLLSFAPALFCAVEVLLLYFDQSVAVNSPVKFICQLSYISYMLVFCAEAGLSLGRGKIYSRYLFALISAATVGGACSLAAVVLTVTGVPCASLSGAGSFVSLVMFVYCIVRLCNFSSIETVEEVKTDAVADVIPDEKIFDEE